MADRRMCFPLHLCPSLQSDTQTSHQVCHKFVMKIICKKNSAKLPNFVMGWSSSHLQLTSMFSRGLKLLLIILTHSLQAEQVRSLPDKV